MSLFGFGGKKGQNAKKSKKSKPREVWQGKSFALDDIITPSVFVGGGENSPDPFLIDLHTVPGSEIDLSQSNLLQALDPNSLELLNQPHLSLLDHQTMSDWLVDPSYQPLPFFDNLGLSTNSLTENIKIFDASNVCSADVPTHVIPPNPDGTSGLPTFTSPDVDSPGHVLPFDPPATDKPPKYNFKKSDQALIGVIDTGFNAKNPDIDYSRVKLGRDLVDNDNNPLLSNGEGNEHGTHVLGIIGATQDNGIGIDGINDTAPVWVGRAIGSGKWAESLKEFVDEFKTSGQPNGVVNLSFDLTQTNPDGSITTRYELTPQEREALEYARQNGVIVVVAAGNNGGTMSALGQASQEFDNIITVGSVDFNKQKTGYSNYGYGLDLMAYGGTPEQPIISTMGDGADIDDEELPEDEMSANAKNAFEEVFGSFSDRNLKDLETDEQELENLTIEERQVYEQATKDIDQLLQDYLGAASQKIALEYVDGYYLASVDALDKFINAFDGDLGNTLLKAQEILDEAGVSTDTVANTNDTNADFSIPLDLGVGEMAGTSVAAAKVTGVVSQVWAANPKLSYQQVKEILKQTAVDLNTPGWDKETGSGLVDIAAAVELAKNTQPQIYQPKPLVSPSTWSGEGQVTAGERAVAVSVPTFTGRIMNAGYVNQLGFLRIRSGPGTQYAEVGRKYPNEAVNFDAYENNGLGVPDPYMPGGGSSRWYKIAGTNNWMSALYIDNTPERAEEERRRQEQIRQAEEAARRAEEQARQAEEAARQAEEELRRLEEEQRRIQEEQRRKQEQFQALVSEIANKYGNPGSLLSSSISNGVTVYQFDNGQVQVQPDGRTSYYSTLKLATQSSTTPPNSDSKRYVDYENLAKKDVYYFAQGKKPLQDVFKEYQKQGYKVEVFSDQKTAFVAIGLTAPPGKRSILIFEGTDPKTNSLTVSDTRLLGIGSDQFEAFKSKGEIERWLKDNSKGNSPDEKNGVDLVGHSLGGALAQMTAAEFPDYVNETVTFNSPGIGPLWLLKASNYKGKVTHFRTDRDLVSSGGLFFLPGEFYTIYFSNPLDDLNPLDDRHLKVYLDDVFSDDPKAKIRQESILDVYGNPYRPVAESVRIGFGFVRDLYDLGAAIVEPSANFLTDKIVQGINATASFTNSAMEALRQKVEGAKEKAEELANQAKAAYETAKANVEQAKAAYQNFKVEVQKATTQIVQQSQQKIKEVAQQVMNSVAQNPIVKAGSKVVNYVANYAQKAVKVVGDIINGAKQFVNNVIDTGKQIINNVIEQGKQAYENVKNFVTEKVEQGKQYVAETYNKVAESVNTVTNTISNGFNGVKSLFGW
ncbi:MAG: S8 family serine peptidase [Nostoc sp.]|uniref:S8 family serine peptidase n=1 Tax=Nostoc sp. TaxID=1180 RepID=UPI002FFAB2E0